VRSGGASRPAGKTPDRNMVNEDFGVTENSHGWSGGAGCCLYVRRNARRQRLPEMAQPKVAA
jgi:hypothetical protein